MLRTGENTNLGWSIMVNGSLFTRYKSFSFSRNIKNQCGQFSIITTNTAPIDYPIQLNDEVKIIYNNQIVFTGVGDRFKSSSGMNGRMIELNGRDKGIGDLIDSSVPDSVKNIKGAVSLRKLCEACISALKIDARVIDRTKEKLADKTEKQQQTAKSGQAIGDFLAKFAAKNQLYTFADENGNLVIYKTDGNTHKNGKKLIYRHSESSENNIDETAFEYDLSNVFAKVKVRGQGSVGYEASANSDRKSTDINADSYDFDARTTRYTEISLNEPTTAANAQKRAIDEVNLRNAQAQKYTCKTYYFWDDEQRPFNIAEIFQINDEDNLCQGEYLLAGFSVNFDIESGTQVDLEFAPPAAFAVIEFDHKTDKQKRGKKNRAKRQTEKERAKTKSIK